VSGTDSRRRWDRDHTKATLARSAERLWDERMVFRRTEALRWRRRFIVCTIGTFLLGLVAGFLIWACHDRRLRRRVPS
jgi:type IV secretory pathway TrbF-like protein